MWACHEKVCLLFFQNRKSPDWSSGSVLVRHPSRFSASGQDHSSRVPRTIGPTNRLRIETTAAHGCSVAAPGSSARNRLRLGDRARQRTQIALWPSRHDSNCRSDAPKQAQGFHALEHSHPGARAGREQKHDSSHLARASAQTAFDQDFQAVTGSEIRGEVNRRGGRVFDAASKCCGAVCR